jgi:HSP20 family protein
MSALLLKPNETSERAFSGMRGISWQVGLHSYAWSPPTDVFESDACFIIRVEVAGMRQADFNINVDEHSVTISGIRADEPDRRAYQQMEIRFGEFNTAAEIPPGLDLTHLEANYEDGFLTVVLPKIKPNPIHHRG